MLTNRRASQFDEMGQDHVFWEVEIRELGQSGKTITAIARHFGRRPKEFESI
jgi:hypothetical protein